MNFKILAITGSEKMFKGQFIQYKVSVLPFVRVKWKTEITAVNEPHYFIDTQQAGPYAEWHHEHHFKEVNGGVEMMDQLTYALPFGFLGRVAHWLFVEHQLKAIFDYRSQVLQKLYPIEKPNL